MKNVPAAIGIALALLALPNGTSARGAAAKIELTEAEWKTASAAAGTWLTLVDDGKYRESWNEASQLLRASMSRLGKGRAFWEKVLEVSRHDRGSVRVRVLGEQEAVSSLPFSPAGKYAIFHYATAFANRSVLNEAVTLRLEDDGEWKVANYLARPASPPK